MKWRLLDRFLGRANAVTTSLRRSRLKASFQEIGADHVRRIPSWTSDDELYALYMLAVSSPVGANALEIGSYLGASTCHLAAGLNRRSGRLFCVDTWQNQTMPEGFRDTFAEFQRNTAPFSDTITAIRKRSELMEAADLDLPLDLVFIDGDHSFEAVAGDFALVSQWLHQDGVVAFHDVGVAHFPGVSRVVGEAIASGDWVIEGIVDSLAWLRRPGPTETPSVGGGGCLR